jgi:hypothetical protein
MNIKHKKKNKLKVFLILDFIMGLLLVMLFEKGVLPSKLHEVIGLVMLALATIHLIIHPSYVVKVTKVVFSRKNGLNKKAKFSYFLNFILLVILILMIISSIMISKDIFGNEGSMFMKDLHKTLAALMILIVGIHIGLHYKMIALKLKMNKVIATILISISLAFGIYSLATTSYTHYLTSLVVSHEGEGKGQGQGKGLHRGGGQGLGEEHEELTGSPLSQLNPPKIGFTIISYASIVYVFCFSTHIVEEISKKRKLTKKS